MIFKQSAMAAILFFKMRPKFFTFAGHNFPWVVFYYPTALKGCRGIVSPMVYGWAGGVKKFVRPVSQKP